MTSWGTWIHRYLSGIAVFLAIVCSVVAWTEHDRRMSLENKVNQQQGVIISIAGVLQAQDKLNDQFAASQQTTYRVLRKMMAPTPRERTLAGYGP